MSQVLITLSFWLHSLATVVFIGHYLLLSLVYVPALSRIEFVDSTGPILSVFSKRSRSWLYASLLTFLLTGTYLTFVDPNYLGLGNFGNLWAILMLVKHILIVGMIAAGFWFNAILRVGPLMSSNNPQQPIVRFRKYVNMMAVMGVLVLFLTTLSQVQ